ncbi:putative leader peptide [Streptomyces himalayensis]|nr:putative leader peptide [Streptomyces himalayensis]
MGRSELDTIRAVRAFQLPLLTSRRHVDLLRVCSAASPLA